MKHTDLKIIFSFLLLVLLVFTGVRYLYVNVIRVATSLESDNNEAYRKSLLTSVAISSLYELEYYGNQLIQSTSDKNLKQYKIARKKLNNNIDSLRAEMTDSSQIERLEMIRLKLIKKNENIKEVIALHLSRSSNLIIQETIDEVISENNRADTIVKPKKEGFFRRVGSLFKKPKIDTSSSANEVMISALETVKRNVTEKQTASNKVVSNKLQTLIATEKAISQQLSMLINELNNEAAVNYAKELSDKQLLLGRAGETISTVSIVAILLIVLSLTTILIDLNKSRHYKNALEKAKKRAEDIMQSRHQLLLSISHDIKAPLSSIMGYTELMERSKSVESIQLSTGYIMDLLTNLLEYSRMESGKAVVTNSKFDFDQTVDQMINIFTPLAREKSLQLISSSPKIGWVEADAIHTRQIIMNLLSNAIKFTSEGVVSLSYEVIGDRLEIRVTDTGCGISKEKQSTIFNEFSRVDESREGNGLGLAVVWGATQLLGGVITCRSELGEGSEFKVLLPVKIVEAERVETHEQSSLFILVVDDDPLQLRMCASMLQKIGHRVITCSSMERALLFLSENSIDLVLSDIQMGTFTGYDLLREIRAKGYTMPVIAVSATEQFQSEGFYALLKKPFTLNELRDVLMISKLDTSSLREMFGDDQESINEIVSIFLATAKENLQKMESYRRDGNRLEIKKLCHKMLPMVAQFKMTVLAGMMASIDRGSADEMTDDEIDQILEELKKL